VSDNPPPSHGTLATLKRTVSEFQEDNLTDWAAALTYYALLSLFPALIALAGRSGSCARCSWR
jgi:membrane protein